MCSIVFFIFTSSLCYYFHQDIYNFLLRPLAKILHGSERKLIYTGLTEAFFSYIKLSLFAGFILAFPFIAVQIYAFLAPGLYKNEKRVIIPYLICAPLLFLLGAGMVYYYIFPMAWKFFISFESPSNSLMPIELQARVSEYLSLVMHLIIAFGLAFQLPVVLTLLVRAGLFSTENLIKKRRLAIVINFAIAAVITPPDVISQLALAVPMCVLYEISIWICKLIEKDKEHKNA